jgi:proteasome lid subunit RPN8/RPN11
MKLLSAEIKVFLELSVREMIDRWVAMASGEISGLGLVEPVPGGFVVREVFLPEQTCGSVNTVIEEEAVAKLLIELDRKGYDTSKLRFWFHSHVNMQTFWSDKDQSTIELLANDDYFVSLVTNKQEEYLARVDIYKPAAIHIDDVPVRLQIPDLKLGAICEEAFKQKVKENGVIPPDLRRDEFFFNRENYDDDFFPSYWEEQMERLEKGGGG